MTGTAVEVKLGVEALPYSAEKATWSTEQTALMESLGLKGVKRRNRGGQWVEEEFEAPVAIVQAFLHQSRTRGLDPFARQIYCIERGGKWGIEASIDGFRLQAERTKKYLGQTEGQWTDGSMTDVPLLHDGQLVMLNGQPLTKREYVWVDAWVSSKPPAAARVGILRDGFAEPIWGVASYAGYCPRDRDGNYKPSGQWEFNAANQLLKCAEMLGFRKAFPTELSGLYGAEEMDQAGSSTAKLEQRPKASAPTQAAIPVQQDIAAPSLTKDWATLAAGAVSVAELTALANEADQLQEIGLKISDEAGSVIDVLRTRRAEIEAAAVTPPMVDVPAARSPKRQWVREARGMTTRADVYELRQQAIAAGALAQHIEEIEAIENTLPDPEASAPTEGGGWPAVAEIPTEWVEGENGEYSEVPAVLDDTVGGDAA